MSAAIQQDARLRSLALMTAAGARDAARTLDAALAGGGAGTSGWSRGVVSIPSGVPEEPLQRALSTLAVACSAGAVALEVAVQRRSEARVVALQAAVECSIAAADRGRCALESVDSLVSRSAFAHAAALAAHTSADAMPTDLAEDHIAWRSTHPSKPAFMFPRSWRDLIDRLGEALQAAETMPMESKDAAEAAHHGALHVAFAFAPSPVAPSGAVRRFVRLTALAAAYAGWALVRDT